MPRREPPTTCPSSLGPLREELPVGRVLWRIHSERYAPVEFNPVPAARKREPGRFDSADGSYASLYAGETRLTAFAEVFLRGETVLASSVRSVPRKKIEGLRLSKLTTGASISFVSLVGAEALGRLGQDSWLTSCDEIDYPITQRYAQSIRQWAPWAQGLVWLAKRDNAHLAYVLFNPPAAAGAIAGKVDRPLDGPGEAFTTNMLARLTVALANPSP